jgi:hypothetical protein
MSDFTIGSDDDAQFDDDHLSKEEQRPKKVWTTMIRPSLLEKLKAIQDHSRRQMDEMSLAHMVDQGLRMFVEQYEDEHGRIEVERHHRVDD